MDASVVALPMLFTWLAEAVVEATDERVSEAELLHRVPGDLLNAAGDQSAAEQHYRQAIAVAEQQSAKLLQLRASISLVQLWRDPRLLLRSPASLQIAPPV